MNERASKMQNIMAKHANLHDIPETPVNSRKTNAKTSTGAKTVKVSVRITEDNLATIQSAIGPYGSVAIFIREAVEEKIARGSKK